MGFDDICNTRLGLGAYRQQQQTGHQQKKKMMMKPLLKYDNLLPSLTLGRPSLEDHNSTDLQQHQASSLSGMSSFSNSSVKKEREDQEVEELERVSFYNNSSRVSDDHEDEEGGSHCRKKLRLTKDQSATLEESFKDQSTLNPKQKQVLAEKLNLRPRQVEVWFQNRRARTKLKQTEVDCELLKKCCETLTEENKRLQKELEELKSMKQTPPFYMQLSAATITVCPSCEKISSVGGDGSSTSHFTFGPKPHFYNPFTHPSAASC